MSTYRVLPAHGQALVDLVVIDPQPRSIGVQATRRTYSASGLVYDEAPYVILEWSVIESATDYTALLAQFDLDTLLSANVTIYARNSQFAFTRYNGRAVRPDPGQSVDWQYFARDVRIVIRDLVAL